MRSCASDRIKSESHALSDKIWDIYVPDLVTSWPHSHLGKNFLNTHQ